MNKFQERVLYEAICDKYPDIVPNEKEDLNIENNKKAMLSKRWYDKNTYPNRFMLAKSLGVSVKTMQNMARSYDLPHRDKLYMK
jgi:hypothetical protein